MSKFAAHLFCLLKKKTGQKAPGKTDGSYYVLGDKYTYKLNICKPLEPAATDNCQSGAAACQLADFIGGDDVSTGNPAGVTFDPTSETFSLVYTGGKGNCHGIYTRSTVITLRCPTLLSPETATPRFLGEAADCSYLFEWATPSACLKSNATPTDAPGNGAVTGQVL
jgi:hypothetical protein